MDDTASGRWEPKDDAQFEAASKALKKRFAAWCQAGQLELDREAPESPLHYKWAYMDRHLTRWRREDLDQLYLELFPAKVIVDEDGIDEVLAEAKAFFSFLGESQLLDDESDPAAELLTHLDEIEPEFRVNMGDPSRFSFGKRIFSEARAEGVEMSDRAAVGEFIARFNARPTAERDAILGPSLKVPRASGRFTPPGTPPRPSRKRRKRH
jgi:hypothetical protein